MVQGNYVDDKPIGEVAENIMIAHNKDIKRAVLQDETFVKIISGSLGIEAFDDFVTQWNEQGGSTILEEIAEMYMK